jgi:hypothetical protein
MNTYTENGMLTPAVVAHLRRTALPANANPIHKLAEGMAFADVCKDLPLPALIQVVGIRRNISKVAAIALAHFYTSPN